MGSIFAKFFKRQEPNVENNAEHKSAPSLEDVDVQENGFPLVPDDYHLRHVGRTAQGNGYWITLQLVSEAGETRDFVAAYVFDKKGYLISCEVSDQGPRNQHRRLTSEEVIQNLKRKIDAKETAEIWVRPFSTSFYGHTFGLVVRKLNDGDIVSNETLIDAMPGWTLMFHGPWSHCNYSS